MSSVDDALGRAEELDATDPLAWGRERFVVPDEKLVYLDGNSLGRLPKATVARLQRVVETEWGTDLISSFATGWTELPGRVGDLIATGLAGARQGEVVVSDSTTVNLYRLAAAALDARPGRRVIVTDRDNFPTDRYVFEGLVAARGGSVRWLDGDLVHGPSVEEVTRCLDDDVALVSLSHVAYRSAAVLDLAGVAAAAHGAGALVLFDLCHSIGAVPIDLEEVGADLAVGCTYKYLNAGPGAPAFLYVRTALQPELRPPVWGWWGRADMLEMEQGFVPAVGITGFLGGTPTVLGLACVEEGARLLCEAGLPALREKGMAITDFAVALFDDMLAPLGFRLGSPRAAERRGSHVTVCRADARSLVPRLAGEGVITDFRTPDGIRLGLAPLSTSYRDIYEGVTRLAELAG